ncbi:MAG: cell filamentation protein Fic [Betaproteobacteria bacterium RIFCSPLOWO2_02_67_12]|nr:MAG: cell filamentation protein Fic [Betaproteobacteria bacterium RIFCSPLOWO2_02_67_12]
MQLNEWEQENIIAGETWAFARRRRNILTQEFVDELHRRMFGRTWRWAGQHRTTEKNIGIDPARIAVALKNLCEDVAVQIGKRAYPLEEIAARFHHRLVSIHPYPNGNGRHARTMTDLLLVGNGAPRFSWGAGDLIHEGEVRSRYIAALQAADQRDYGPLLRFARSGSGK